jgi:exopolysaccharide biosynthesis polyprenyl glycosylphosphotransferase
MAVSLRHALIAVQRTLDMLCLTAAFCALLLAQNADLFGHSVQELLALRVTFPNLVLIAVFLLVWRGSSAAFGLHRLPAPAWHPRRAVRIIAAFSVATVTLAMLRILTGSDPFEPRALVYFWLTGIVTVLGSRGLLDALTRLTDRYVDGRKHTVIVGSGPRALAVFQALNQDSSNKYDIMGFVDSKHGHGVPPEVRARLLGSIDNLENILVRSTVDRVLITLPVRSCYAEIQRTIRICERVGVESHYLSDVFALSVARQRYDDDERFPFVKLQVVSDDARLIVKRVIDVAGAVAGLVLLSPLLLLCALLVKFTSPGPIFFAQDRYGLNRRLFKMIKFRTMVHDAEARQLELERLNESQGPVFKIRRDPRLTAIGWFLRKSSIDELPQLINVLRGEMSLVGPRPLPVRDVSRFSEAWLMRRFSVKPGLTSLWQISGRSNIDFDRWVALDLEYIDNWSLALDFKILLRTVPTVLSGSGAM